jgi:hypothetical protein
MSPLPFGEIENAADEGVVLSCSTASGILPGFGITLSRLNIRQSAQIDGVGTRSDGTDVADGSGDGVGVSEGPAEGSGVVVASIVGVGDSDAETEDLFGPQKVIWAASKRSDIR